jgi:hypothetical protein
VGNQRETIDEQGEEEAAAYGPIFGEEALSQVPFNRRTKWITDPMGIP